jgi:hypothetical protein
LKPQKTKLFPFWGGGDLDVLPVLFLEPFNSGFNVKFLKIKQDHQYFTSCCIIRNKSEYSQTEIGNNALGSNKYTKQLVHRKHNNCSKWLKLCRINLETRHQCFGFF